MISRAVSPDTKQAQGSDAGRRGNPSIGFITQTRLRLEASTSVMRTGQEVLKPPLVSAA